MSEKTHPKYSFSKKLGGGEFLNVAVWPGRSNPEDEVVSVQLRKFEGDWQTPGKGGPLQDKGRRLFRTSGKNIDLG